MKIRRTGLLSSQRYEVSEAPEWCRDTKEKSYDSLGAEESILREAGAAGGKKIVVEWSQDHQLMARVSLPNGLMIGMCCW